MSTTAKETSDVDRPETLLLIGSASNELFKEENGGTAFDLSRVNFALDQSMIGELSSSFEGNSISSDRLRRSKVDRPLTTEDASQLALEKLSLVVLRGYYEVEATANATDFNFADSREPSQAIVQTSKLMGTMKSTRNLLTTARSLVEQLKERPQWPPHAVASLIVHLFTLVQHAMLGEETLLAASDGHLSRLVSKWCQLCGPSLDKFAGFMDNFCSDRSEIPNKAPNVSQDARKKAGYLLIAARTFEDQAALANEVISCLGEFVVGTQGIANGALESVQGITTEAFISREDIEPAEKSVRFSQQATDTSKTPPVPPQYTVTGGVPEIPLPRSPPLSNHPLSATVQAPLPIRPEPSGATSYNPQPYGSVVMPGGFLPLHHPPSTTVTGQGIGSQASNPQQQSTSSTHFTSQSAQQHQFPPALGETPTQTGQEALASTVLSTFNRSPPHSMAPHTQSLLSGFPSPNPFDIPPTSTTHVTGGFRPPYPASAPPPAVMTSAYHPHPSYPSAPVTNTQVHETSHQTLGEAADSMPKYSPTELKIPNTGDTFSFYKIQGSQKLDLARLRTTESLVVGDTLEYRDTAKPKHPRMYVWRGKDGWVDVTLKYYNCTGKDDPSFKHPLYSGAETRILAMKNMTTMEPTYIKPSSYSSKARQLEQLTKSSSKSKHSKSKNSSTHSKGKERASSGDDDGSMDSD